VEGLDPNVQAAVYGAVAMLVVKAIDIALGRQDRARSVRDELRAELKVAREERDLEVRRRRDAEDRERSVRDERDEAETAVRLARAVADEAVQRMRAEQALRAMETDRREQVESELRERDEQITILRAQLEKAQRQARLRLLGPGDTDPDDL
jgi:5-enolpyruvylshikimate-3-phosphate synthase